MGLQHGGHQPDQKHHGGNRPGEDRPHEKPETVPIDERPDANRPGVNVPDAESRQRKPGPDPDQPDGRRSSAGPRRGMGPT